MFEPPVQNGSSVVPDPPPTLGPFGTDAALDDALPVFGGGEAGGRGIELEPGLAILGSKRF
jgi:hypothetical protein